MAALSVEREQRQAAGGEITDSRWNSLYQIAGAASIVTVAFIPIQIAVFLAWPPPGYEPTPGTVLGWFTLFHNHRLLALVDLDLLLIVDEVLAVPIILALYVALKRAGESVMLLATALGFVGIAAFFASNTTFSLLSLSSQYAAAATEAQKSMYVAAGQAMIALYSGTAFQTSYVLGSLTIVMTCAVIWRSRIFSRAAAYVGIVASVVGLGLYVPRVGIYISVASVPFWAIWNILIARGLFQLARNLAKGEATP